MSCLIAIDIGGTKIRIARLSHHYELLNSTTIATPHSLAEAKAAILEAIDVMAAGNHVQAIGVAAPAAIDRLKGSIGPFSNLAWPRFAIRNWLTRQYHCPVIIEHDATAAAICEANIGAGQKYRYQLFVTISTGIGSALTLDGKPLPGPHNTEGGHIMLEDHPHSLRVGSFEYLASGRAIVREYGKIAAEIHSASDWSEISRNFARGLHNLIMTTDPQVIVLGGGVSVHYKRFIKPLTHHLKTFNSPPSYPPPPILQAKYVETAPLLGVGLLASGAVRAAA